MTYSWPTEHEPGGDCPQGQEFRPNELSKFGYSCSFAKEWFSVFNKTRRSHQKFAWVSHPCHSLLPPDEQNLSGKLRDQDPCFRAVVFSQFTSFLDLIQMALERERFDHYRFDGTMDIKKKGAAITEFKSASRKPKVLVVSLKAGGVGLNVSVWEWLLISSDIVAPADHC